MRTKAASIVLFLLAVLGLGCSSSSNHPGRYVPISRGSNDGVKVLDTQTGRVWVYLDWFGENIWIARTESIPDVPIGKEPPPPPPPPAPAPADR